MRRAKLFGLDLQVDVAAVGGGGRGNRPWQHLSDAELQEKIDTLSMAVGVRVDVNSLGPRGDESER